MSGGVDSAVAALLERERGAEVIARHPQALGRPRDRRRQGLLLAGGGARRPRRRPLDRRPPPDPRPRGGVPPPGGRQLPLRLRRRRDAQPLHRLQRRGEDRGDDRPRRAARRHPPGHRPLRADRRRRLRAAARRRRRRGQGPELHAGGAAAGAARPGALPADRAEQARGARDRRPPRPRGRPQAREPGPLLPRRPGQGAVPAPPRRAWASARARSSTAPARAIGTPPRPPQLHRRPAPRDRRLGARGRSTCSPPTPAPNTVTVGTREELATSSVRLRDAVLHRAGDRVDAVRLRYHSRAVPAAVAGRRRGRRPITRPSRSSWARRSSPPRPGQTAVLLAGEAIVGHGTIAAAA